MSPAPFADRLADLVRERRSQVCLGLDPDPAAIQPAAGRSAAEGAGAAERAAAAIVGGCGELIERAGPACVAAKP
jgi:orotidine-5'-phosphate decarboxylase